MTDEELNNYLIDKTQEIAKYVDGKNVKIVITNISDINLNNTFTFSVEWKS